MINKKEILILGGTGSLGKTLLQILLNEYKPHGIRIFSRDELKQWELQQQVKSWNKNNIPVAFLIGDIRNKDRLYRAMNRVDIVINCAAMKQVPACEFNPFEAVETNITGSKNIIDCCIDNDVRYCFHISTDKAVYPINLYGKTKAVAESLFIHGNVYSGLNGTRFNVCRYGNVLGSRGSIIPLFLEQAKTGTITITDRKMTRFWITLDQVAQFIIDRVNDEIRNISPAGNIYIPKMPSMKVVDIATTICPGVPIKDIGIRKGEKLHECLITFEESQYMTEMSTFYILQPLQPAVPNFKNWAYYTDTNNWWLSPIELQEMIK